MKNWQSGAIAVASGILTIVMLIYFTQGIIMNHRNMNKNENNDYNS